ncbi:60S ribosomal L10a [Carpediemonas membranifera]|uniref:Ribosomal protein n=1 Tax=Carpediemonas membranifera TaxID=201153 RepID=A0A8J6AQW4_9EUKA|nr:60S ribosomal L10a [Carpediemonas membranifera]|eukprot:KAG9391951.1 60S ribosomal L10a [Carpediemonas membranifera]
MLSKIPSDFLRESISKIVAASAEKPRKFTETIELQIGLKGYDPQKDKRFSGSFVLPTNPRPNAKICLLLNESQRDAALAAGITVDIRTEEQLKAFKKAKKVVKRFAKSYDAFLCSDTMIKRIPRILGPTLSKAGKFPTALTDNDDVAQKIAELQSTIKFQLKKVLCLNTAIGHLKMTEEEIYKNLVLSINFLVSLLKKKWQNVKCLYIKTTMGHPIRIY